LKKKKEALIFRHKRKCVLKCFQRWRECYRRKRAELQRIRRALVESWGDFPAVPSGLQNPYKSLALLGMGDNTNLEKESVKLSISTTPKLQLQKVAQDDDKNVPNLQNQPTEIKQTSPTPIRDGEGKNKKRELSPSSNGQHQNGQSVEPWNGFSRVPSGFQSPHKTLALLGLVEDMGLELGKLKLSVSPAPKLKVAPDRVEVNGLQTPIGRPIKRMKTPPASNSTIKIKNHVSTPPTTITPSTNHSPTSSSLLNQSTSQQDTAILPHPTDDRQVGQKNKSTTLLVNEMEKERNKWLRLEKVLSYLEQDLNESS